MSQAKPTIAVCVTSLAATPAQLQALPAAVKCLEKYFEVVLCKDIQANGLFDSRSVSNRIASLNWAAQSGDIIMSWNGGYNAIELMFEFDKLKIPQDKIFVGYSDNTLLVNALPALNVCRGWMGPMLATFTRLPEYGELWAQSLRALYDGDYAAAEQQYNQVGMTVYRLGKMSGKVWGGNSYTFDLLQGTRFCPQFNEPFILLLEGEDFITAKNRVWQDFIRNLDSVMLLPGAADNLQGLLIGRFPNSYKLNVREVEVEASFKSRPYLRDIPIVYNFPRGYGLPSLYLPIGEALSMNFRKNNTMELNKL